MNTSAMTEELVDNFVTGRDPRGAGIICELTSCRVVLESEECEKSSSTSTAMEKRPVVTGC